ncbi:MCE family protein [Labedaea rhizosphaerae]|uniref:Phospholipid/cholesterol/gamma-HCH transport system substrate-binding protein n=1 Tax=Labedaea rhizosphaerae TaxID=598644 RepID=A0A4R6S8H6_LABRH|nr:MCE family protein [Labedaea rhizosphaerae]TDP95166.1 phospholipid/cholesterol/gamma-HCH transport system substrate-binding protein [Labedaea rhizosphaerae]
MKLSPRGVRRAKQLGGLAFLVVIAMLGALAVAIYDKAFTDVVKVTLRTDHVGNQLRVGSDVKVRGLLVGEVRAIHANGRASGGLGGDEAEIELALQPDKVDLLPANVSARLLPKTLFGERYVDLHLPATPDAHHLGENSVIQQDRSTSAIELEQVLNNLMPVLQAVRPEKLATTLTALSQALDGRGQKLGKTLVSLNSYLDRFNPKLPEVTEDLDRLADFADTYATAAPDLVQALSDLTVTSRTFADQRQQLAALFTGLTTASDDLTTFLAASGPNLILLAGNSRKTLELLAEYSGTFPCLFDQLNRLRPLVDKAFGAGTKQPGAHVQVTVVPGRGKYVPGRDDPSYTKHGAPECYLAGGVSAPVNPTPAATTAPAKEPVPTGDLGVPNSPQEQELVSELIAPSLGVAPAQVPGWSSVLVGPLYRGAEVTLK